MNYKRYLPYNHNLKGNARKLRNNSIKGEIKFWCELLRKGQSGYQFYRQKILDNFIVDFYCPKLKLIIEIDGTSHIDKEEYDNKREQILINLGLKVVRYPDLDVLYNFHVVEKHFKETLEIRKAELKIK